MTITIPPAFRTATTKREGAAGREWLAALPGLVDGLLDRWSCRQDGEVRHGGVGIAVPVARQHRSAILKVSFPHPGNISEWGALAAFEGRGAVRLYDVDADRFAMLLERARPEDLSSVPDVDDALTIAGRIARRLAVPAPLSAPRLSEITRRAASELADHHAGTDRSDRLPEPVVNAAVATFDHLADEVSDTLIHGDLHFTNVLAAEREPWLAIDPKGIAGTPCFDAATVVRHRLLDMVRQPGLAGTLAHRVELFSDAASVDFLLALRCTQARFVSSYYWELRHRSQPLVVAAMRDASIAAAKCLS
jgi:streptomycin 6-kinase